MDPLLATDGINKAINIAAPAEAYGLIDAASSFGSPSGTSSSAVAPATLPAHVANELLVQFLPGTGVEERARVRGLVGANLAETIHTAAMQRSGNGVLERITITASGGGLDQVREALARNPLVAFVDLNYLYTPALVSNDSYYTNGSLWGMYGDDSPQVGPSGTSNAYGIQAEKAWNDGITGSRNVVVGIIDEGIQISHPDLAGNIWVNPFEIAGDGIDNDGNGYIDDINGWDFVANDNSVYDAGQDSHGTHVAGTIGGMGGNGAGVAGVNWDVTMISTKFLGPTGGSTANAIKALDYLTDLKNRHGINLVATNNSWGGGGYSQALHDAIIRAAKKEILFVAAAGNSTTNNDTSASYPSNYNTTVGTSTQTAASYDSVIAVASITSTGAISSFSSYGATTVDIGAPGSGVWSSVPTDTYASYNGTSMATPHVTGAAALYASMQPTGLTAAAIKAALLNSATPTTSLTGKTATGGRLNVYAALQQSAFLSLDRSVYSLPSQIGISINHAAANTSSTVAESVTVTIRSTTETTPETVVLTETGANTGRFTGSIQALTGSPVADGRLQVADGNQITAFYAALNQTMTAMVDTSAPAISALATTAKSTSSDIRWNTNEASSTEVIYGTSASSLSATITVAGMVTSHTAPLGGLTPSTTYYYQVRSRDGAGNLSSSTVQSFTTTAPAPILFVDDDMGASYERFYTAALQANGYTFDTWNAVAIGATPTATDLKNYSLVIWNTGYDYSSVGAGLSSTEQTAIANYLDAGGRIFISGQDILFNGVSTTFLSNYLKVASFTSDVITAAHTETGVAGNPVSNTQALTVSAPSDFPSLYVDAVSPVSGAEASFLHGVSTAASPYSAINYRGNYGAGGFGMVFTTFPFEAVSASASDPNNQKVLLKRIVEYLNGSSVQAGFSVSAPSPTATTSEIGASLTFTVSLSTAPTATVTIPVASSNPSEGTVNTSSLTFTTANWATAQSVTVTGVNDDVDDGNIPYWVVLGAATSADVAYNGRDPGDVALTNIDDDTAGITVSAPSGTFTSEDGSTVTFTVKLNSRPLVNVAIPISSSNSNEATVSTASLLFTPNNWNAIQTVTVTGVNDDVYDGNQPYSVVIGPASAPNDGLYHLMNPADISLINNDNDPVPVARFFVVSDTTVDRTYRYAASGSAIDNYAISSGNTAPRGIATTSTGDTSWVVDKNRNVYVYDKNGNLIVSWTAGGLSTSSTVEGIATDGINIWIVDSKSDKLYYYANAAGRMSGGTASATGIYSLASGNANAKDVVFGTDGTNRYLWVVDDGSSIDRVYRYTLSANGSWSASSSWTLNSINKLPTGIALDPSNGSLDLWVVDSGTNQVYRYGSARTLSAPTLSDSFALTAGNTNPQGIADPIAPAMTPLDTGAGAGGAEEDPIVAPNQDEGCIRLSWSNHPVARGMEFGRFAGSDKQLTKPTAAPFSPTGGAGPTARAPWFLAESFGRGRRAHPSRWQRRLARLAWLPFQPGR